jgi:hypothetical protein
MKIIDRDGFPVKIEKIERIFHIIGRLSTKYRQLSTGDWILSTNQAEYFHTFAPDIPCFSPDFSDLSTVLSRFPARNAGILPPVFHQKDAILHIFPQVIHSMAAGSQFIIGRPWEDRKVIMRSRSPPPGGSARAEEKRAVVY